MKPSPGSQEGPAGEEEPRPTCSTSTLLTSSPSPSSPHGTGGRGTDAPQEQLYAFPSQLPENKALFPTGKEPLKSLQSTTAHSSRDAVWTGPAQGGLTSSPWVGSQFHPVTAPSWRRQEQPVETACFVPHPSTFLCSCPGPRVGTEPWPGKKRL